MALRIFSLISMNLRWLKFPEPMKRSARLLFSFPLFESNLIIDDHIKLNFIKFNINTNQLFCEIQGQQILIISLDVLFNARFFILL